MRPLEIEVETTDGRLDFDLMRSHSVTPGQTATAPGGAEITWQGRTMFKGGRIPEAIALLVSFGKELAIGVFASWLYDTIKGRSVRLRIRNVEVEIDKKLIERVIRDCVDADESGKLESGRLAAVKSIRLSMHAQGYFQRRGFTVAEVEEAIRTAPWTSAELGRLECRLDLPFRQVWNGKQYETKQIRPIFIDEPAEILVVTVYTYYF